ncbi:uncharacterized protein [Arachis hypogaea]|uniref:uncharacterized protein n=1 Tax=Arachis hypogaea TaxID=3818 RepID=UPI003B221929
MATGDDTRSLSTTVCKWTYLGHAHMQHINDKDSWDMAMLFGSFNKSWFVAKEEAAKSKAARGHKSFGCKVKTTSMQRLNIVFKVIGVLSQLLDPRNAASFR